MGTKELERCHVDSAIDKIFDLNPVAVQQLQEAEVDATSYTLADAIREGATLSGQARGWADGSNNLCALSSALAAVRARRAA